MQGWASTWRELYAIVRPCGRRRLALVLGLTLAQALLQTLAVFSLLPFLGATADIEQFRHSRPGSLLLAAIGDVSDQRLMVWTGALSLAMLVASNLLALAAEYVRSRYAYLVGHRLRVSLLEDLLDRRYEYFLGINSSVLLKKLLDDTGRVAELMVLPALDIAARAALVAMLAASVAVIEPLIVLGGAGLVVIYYATVVRPFRRRAKRSSEAFKQNVRSLYLGVTETLNAAKPILAAGHKSWFVERAARISQHHAAEMPKIPLYAAIPRVGLELLVFGGMVAWVLATLLAGGNLVAMIPRLGFIAIVAYRVMPSVQIIFMQLSTMTSSSQALEEVSEMLGEQSAMSDKGSVQAKTEPVHPMHWETDISFDQVSFTYAGARQPTLKDISFTIGKGQRIAFVGPTGSGKTTLIDLILGLLYPTSGRILVDSEPLVPEMMPAWRRAMGYVPQDLFLLDNTIAQNISFGADEGKGTRQRILDVAEIAQARQFVEEGQPRGFDTIVGERGVRLSGGQRQRLALARALFGRPNVLVLDEATSALDPVTEQKVVGALAHEHDRLTVITVTHRLNTVKDYDCIHYVEHGRIVASGDYATLLKSHAFFRETAH